MPFLHGGEFFVVQMKKNVEYLLKNCAAEIVMKNHFKNKSWILVRRMKKTFFAN